ncbi:hypothetical protein BGZ49_000472 [Haplosporangium sp. Z 27]|nr:hypothetical protein BGZ49_000472 [Haplosporangium sp. Z 27]
MALTHLIIHRFSSGSNSHGIESSGTIEQFMQRESNRPHHRQQPQQQQQQHGSILPQHYSFFKSLNQSNTPNGTIRAHNNPTTSVSAPASYVCNECLHEESEDDVFDEERYNDSEYVDDEVTSLLNNAFLQIGKTPNSRMDDTLLKRNGSHDGEDGDDDESIDVVIGDHKDKILRQATNPRNNGVNNDDLDLDFEDSFDHHQRSGARRNSWSTASTHSQQPFAPISKKKKSGTGPRAKGRYGSVPTSGSARQYSPTTTTTSSQPSTSVEIPRPDYATHLRRTSFPRLKAQNTIYSRHDSLDHTVADDREHADLTQIGIQTALTIAIHKFPEGLITFLSTTVDPCLGLSVFMAIAVHNLIEGYLIAFPLYIGLHSRAKAFGLAAILGGLSQPLGAVLGWFILRKVASLGWKVSATGAIYALVAGMMASIVVNGMWPQAVKCVGRNPTKVVQYCFFIGIAVMGICQAVMGKECDF